MLVSSSDLKRVVKSNKLTLGQIMKVLQRRNLLKKRKNKSKSTANISKEIFKKESVTQPRFRHQKREGRRDLKGDVFVQGLSPVSDGWRTDAAKVSFTTYYNYI